MVMMGKVPDLLWRFEGLTRGVFCEIGEGTFSLLEVAVYILVHLIVRPTIIISQLILIFSCKIKYSRGINKNSKKLTIKFNQHSEKFF